jgi:hypothetical protein
LPSVEKIIALFADDETAKTADEEKDATSASCLRQRREGLHSEESIEMRPLTSWIPSLITLSMIKKWRLTMYQTKIWEFKQHQMRK